MIRKSILLAVIVVLMSPVMALAQVATSDSISKGVGIAVSAPTISPTINPSISGTASSSPTNNSTNDVGALAVIQSYPNYQQPQNLPPYLLQMVPGMAGRIPEGDVPEFYAIQRLKLKKVWMNPATGEEKVVQEADKVIRVEPYTRGGRWMGFSRIEDYDQDLLALVPKVITLFGQKDTTNIRFDVSFKTSQKSIGSNAGGGGSAAGFQGGVNPVAWGSNVAGIGAFAVNTFDPKITLKFYLIKAIDPLKKVSESEYKEQGWVKVDVK